MEVRPFGDTLLPRGSERTAPGPCDQGAAARYPWASIDVRATLERGRHSGDPVRALAARTCAPPRVHSVASGTNGDENQSTYIRQNARMPADNEPQNDRDSAPTDCDQPSRYLPMYAVLSRNPTASLLHLIAPCSRRAGEFR